MMKTSYLDYMQRVIDGSGRQSDMLASPMNRADAHCVRKMQRLPEIVNESNLTGSDNVGGFSASQETGEQDSCASSNGSATPAFAASDDDGDGDSDGEDDRRPKRRITSPLPPAQLLRPKAACALLGIGRTKLWQLSERDPRFPRKIVLGARCVGWRIDALNDYLRTLELEG